MTLTLTLTLTRTFTPTLALTLILTIMKVKSNLKRADLLLRAFMRRMATDKIFMVFMCLIFCGIIAIIAAKALDVEGTEDLNAPTPDELKSSIGGDDVRRRLRFDRDSAGA